MICPRPTMWKRSHLLPSSLLLLLLFGHLLAPGWLEFFWESLHIQPQPYPHTGQGTQPLAHHTITYKARQTCNKRACGAV